MVYTIRLERDFLRADLFNRETAEESREFFDQVADLAQRKGCRNILIWVHSSAPLFDADRSGFFAQLHGFGADPAHKIGLMADTVELGHAHAYFEQLGALRGVNVRQFSDQLSALAWFRGAGT